MSFKTIATLDPDRTDVQHDLRDRDRMHKRLMSLYPDGLGDNPRQAINLLFAVEPGTTNVLIQSDLRPVTGPLNTARNGYFTQVKTEETHSGLDFNTGDIVQFCFWMAALKRETNKTSRCLITDDAEIVSKGNSLLSRSGLEAKDIAISTMEKISSAKRKINYFNALLVGQGQVTDAEKLKAAIIRGIGAGRLWGSGVLLVSANR